MRGYILSLSLPLFVAILFFNFNNLFSMHKAKNVVVIGGGLAGLSASLEAAHRGARVYLLEKMKNIGGNSAKATSGMNGIHTPAQKKANVDDSHELFKKDTMKSGGGYSNEKLVDVLVEESTEAISFLENLGLKLSALSQLGGHCRKRTHREAPREDGRPSPVGWDIVSTLKNHVTKMKEIEIMTSCRVTELLSSDKTIYGVKYMCENGEEKEIKDSAVILTSGGFGCDRGKDSLLSQYAPEISHLPTTNGPQATGDGIRLVKNLGADIIGMDAIQIHPTGFLNPSDPLNPTKFLAPEALRGCGAILLTKKGKRFVNELEKRDVVSKAIFNHCEALEVEGKEGPVYAYLILNEKGAQDFGIPSLSFYASKGLIKKYESWEDFSKASNIPRSDLNAIIESYGSADPFGKTVFPIKFTKEDKIWVALITPSIHYTMGGIAIDEKGRVLNNKKEVMKGLFAAGEVTGGVHGKNRLGGNSLLECVVFGRRAGKYVMEEN